MTAFLRSPAETADPLPLAEHEADQAKRAEHDHQQEQHAEKVKHEVQVIWSDYFKPEHLAAFPDLHTKVWNLLKLAGKNKQGVDAQAAADLLAQSRAGAAACLSGGVTTVADCCYAGTVAQAAVEAGHAS